MENRMTRMEDAVQQLNAATDEVAADLERLRTEVQGSDAAAADRLTPIIERLRSLGQDPQNPVPEPPPSV
jgi:outer membrane murein-binding lipoprotein Lpp